jgi:hypothetical protein
MGSWHVVAVRNRRARRLQNTALSALIISGLAVAALWREAFAYRVQSGEGVALGWAAVGSAVVTIAVVGLIAVAMSDERHTGVVWCLTIMVLVMSTGSTAALLSATAG